MSASQRIESLPASIVPLWNAKQKRARLDAVMSNPSAAGLNRTQRRWLRLVSENEHAVEGMTLRVEKQAKRLRVSVRTVQYAARECEARGLVTRDERTRPESGSQASNAYRLNVDSDLQGGVQDIAKTDNFLHPSVAPQLAPPVAPLEVEQALLVRGFSSRTPTEAREARGMQESETADAAPTKNDHIATNDPVALDGCSAAPTGSGAAVSLPWSTGVGPSPSDEPPGLHWLQTVIGSDYYVPEYRIQSFRDLMAEWDAVDASAGVVRADLYCRGNSVHRCRGMTRTGFAPERG